MRRTSLPRTPPPARLPLPLTRRLNIVRTLLVRGMLAGLLAALAALVVASVAGEPQVREAIALEGAGHADRALAQPPLLRRRRRAGERTAWCDVGGRG